ncbi:MAG: hypothetical protein M3417_11590 [Actinomycetota bacterium]|nr:hypothetical protein [Actinomycetota bacterium]
MTAGSPDERPDPNATPCVDCRHVWFAGERQHVYVAVRDKRAAQEEDEEVVCVLCRQGRERPPSSERWSW